MNDLHVGGDFDEFLSEEGLLQEATAVAVTRLRKMLLDGACSDPVGEFDPAYFEALRTALGSESKF